MRRLLVVLALAGCRERTPPVDAAPSDPVITIRADAHEPVQYVDLAGQVRRALGVDSVPAASRHAVAVDGPDGTGGAIWIADVSTPAASWTARRALPGELERRGLAALPPGVASRLGFPAPADVAPAPDGVVVYGTAWCGACDDSKAWLDARHVPYRFRDVELDAAAAADAAALCAALDVPADRVPVIDLAGKVIVGFDPTRMTTILGAPI